MSFGKKFFSNKISYLNRNCYVPRVQLILLSSNFLFILMLKNRIVFFYVKLHLNNESITNFSN